MISRLLPSYALTIVIRREEVVAISRDARVALAIDDWPSRLGEVLGMALAEVRRVARIAGGRALAVDVQLDERVITTKVIDDLPRLRDRRALREMIASELGRYFILPEGLGGGEIGVSPTGDGRVQVALYDKETLGTIERAVAGASGTMRRVGIACGDPSRPMASIVPRNEHRRLEAHAQRVLKLGVAASIGIGSLGVVAPGAVASLEARRIEGEADRQLDVLTRYRSTVALESTRSVDSVVARRFRASRQSSLRTLVGLTGRLPDGLVLESVAIDSLVATIVVSGDSALSWISSLATRGEFSAVEIVGGVQLRPNDQGERVTARLRRTSAVPSRRS